MKVGLYFFIIIRPFVILNEVKNLIQNAFSIILNEVKNLVQNAFSVI